MYKPGMYKKFQEFLGRPVDTASLVVFRVLFGITMLVEVYRYFSHDWIGRYYIRPDFYFKYYGFEWVQPWEGAGMYWHFAALGLLSIFITVGLFYRVSMIAFFLGFSYVFLLDQTRYLNHFYLVMLVCFAMCMVPANRAFSLDSKIRPRLYSQTIPAWGVWVLVALFEITLLYAGLVKVNSDWLHLQPLTMWFAKRQHLSVFGGLLTEQWFIALSAWGSVALHLIGAPLLLWRKTRPYVFVVYVIFHLSNHVLWQIGIFPWLTIAGTLMFFEPDWPRRFTSWMLRRLGLLIEWAGRLKRGTVSDLLDKSKSPDNTVAERTEPYALQWWVTPLILLFTGYQILMPLRHFLYPGDVAWTEEGHRFAWRMKLRDKKGETFFAVTNPATGEEWEVDPLDYLKRKQFRRMSCRPDMILQFAHFLADTWKRELEVENPEVRAWTDCSLNGRRSATLIDPDRDLATVKRDLGSADWILPLDEPLPPWPGAARIARSRN